jgi:hypothetical protein
LKLQKDPEREMGMSWDRADGEGTRLLPAYDKSFLSGIPGEMQEGQMGRRVLVAAEAHVLSHPFQALSRLDPL